MRLEESFLNSLAQDNLSDERQPMRIDITGVAPPAAAPEEVGPAPDDLTAAATEMAGGTEPAGATPMTIGEFATSIADAPAGLLKGAVQGTIGLPGDIESLTYGVREIFNRGAGESALDAFLTGLEQKTVLPTTENVRAWLDTNVGPLVPAGASERRREAAKIPEFVGELGGAGKTVIESAKAASRGLGQVAGASADVVRPATLEAQAGVVRPSAFMPEGQVQPTLTLPGATPQQASRITKIVDDGIAQGMSATKILQSIEAKTAQKPTGKQAKEIKQYISDKTPKGKIYSDQAFKDLIAQPFPMEPSTANFTKSFNAAIEFLAGLDAQGLKTTAQDADKLLGPILGTSKQGKVNRLLTTNGKLLKTEKGVEGSVPIELPDGRNIESAGLAISPAFKVGKFSTCPNSASCAQECLGKTSGGYFAYGGGADLDAMKGTRLRSFRMTQAMFREPEAFAIKVHNEIISLKKAAEKRGNALAIRLNVLSDIDPKVHEAIIKAHPDVFFYDYTKMKYKPIAPNHHYTYSSTGTSQKAGINGMTTDVDNPHTNWAQMRDRLDSGDNVAMAFSNKKALPETVLDEATGKVYRVIDGDAYDFRPMDKQPPGVDGVIVGLKNKAMTRKESAAVQESNGFFVPYDPQFLKDGKKLRKNEFGDLIPGNTQVIIPNIQKKKTIDIAVEGKSTQVDTGEQITERAKQ
jgi:hypothetical protein